MYSRVVTFDGQPGKLKEGSRVWKEKGPSIPATGLRDAYFLADEKTGKCIIVSFWDSLQDLNATANAIIPIRDAVSRAIGATSEPTIEVYEIAAEYGGAMRKAA